MLFYFLLVIFLIYTIFLGLIIYNYYVEVEDLLDMSESPQQEVYQSPAQNFGNQELMNTTNNSR